MRVTLTPCLFRTPTNSPFYSNWDYTCLFGCCLQGISGQSRKSTKNGILAPRRPLNACVQLVKNRITPFVIENCCRKLWKSWLQMWEWVGLSHIRLFCGHRWQSSLDNFVASLEYARCYARCTRLRHSGYTQKHFCHLGTERPNTKKVNSTSKFLLVCPTSKRYRSRACVRDR